MTVSFKTIQLEMNFEETAAHTLIIENKELFRNVITAFLTNRADDYFVFYDNYKVKELNEVGFYINQPILPDITNKKLMTKINSQLEKVLNSEFASELTDVGAVINQLAAKLLEHFDFDFDYSYEVNAKDIVKLLGFKTPEEVTNHAEYFAAYAKLITKYLSCKLLVVNGLHLYFTKEEIDEIIKTLKLNNICLLILEAVDTGYKGEYEQIHIIDKDLCRIDSPVIR